DKNDNKNNNDNKNEKGSKKVKISAGAGVSLGMLAQKLLKESISGFEFASGIPGTIGGAVRMNAGAYGGEFKDIVISTKCIDENGNISILNNEEQEFSYRHSIFMNKNLIILESELLLNLEQNSTEIAKKMQENLESRKSKQPLNMPNAGSTFKRGEDYITAKLIDECGLKGFAIGGAQVSDIHAGFIVNKGNATAKDILNLIEYVKQKVFEKFSKEIKLEIEVLGE
ncbi:MAG: UDP-N-acetylmuramate dehydrogenase, partial [Clostridia bacterium]|nr:UDP-N-acetylmuramate dehydrogenase [Clostridia bacterium]